jgi:hypothetical protein
LSRHFHNSNGKKVPPAVKDKKELRNKLVERGLIKEELIFVLLFFCHTLIYQTPLDNIESIQVILADRENA